MRDYVLTLLVTAAVTYMLTPLVRRVARRIGAIKKPRDRDVHTAAVPTIGGLAMYGGLAAGLLVADQIKNLRDGFANTGMVSGLLLAGGLLVVVGIIDDRWGLSPLMKAAGQVAAGGILVATGTQLNWIPLPGGQTFLPTSDQATVLTILIVVATINAVNFIDGLDGLAAGIVAIAAVSFFLYYYSMTKVIDISSLAAPALASAVLIGMCLGFLPHNFSPASIFMGDTGSMLLGLLLAYAPISSLPSLDPAVLASHINRYPVILPLLLPAALLVIPYADLLLAVIRRTRAGQSPFAPDRKHLHHRLLDIGHSQRASVLIMYLWAAIFSGSVVWLSVQRTQQPGGPNTNHHGHPVVVFIAITAAAVIVLLLMSLPMLRHWGRGARHDEAAPAQAGASGLTAPAAPASTVPVSTGPASTGPASTAPASRAPARTVPASAMPRRSVPGNGVPVRGASSRRRLSAAELEPTLAAAAALDPALAAAAEIEPVLAPAAELQPPAAAPEAANGSAEPQLVAAAVVRNGAAPTRDWADSGWSTQGWPGAAWTDPDWTNPDWGRRSHAAPPSVPADSDQRGHETPGRHAPSDGPSDSVWPNGSNSREGTSQAGPNRGGARSIIGTPPPAVTSLDAEATPAAGGQDPERSAAPVDEN